MTPTHGVLIDAGGPTDPNSVSLGTRHTRHITNEMRREWAPDQLKMDLERCLGDFPNIQVRSVTALYNCVGMVFATRRTWVDPAHVPQLLQDDEYKQLEDIKLAQVGDISVYKTEDGQIRHVGLIIERIDYFDRGSVEFKILSKWGPWAEFIHSPTDLYASWGQLTEAWTDRKSV